MRVARWLAIAVVISSCWAPCLRAGAQNLVTIDAAEPVPAAQPVAVTLLGARNPKGSTIGVNSQYLTLDGKPWLPVMGEFHFSRYPEAEWEEEILKMKAAGVQIISTYVIWIHHEQTEGVFDWSGQRDLRRFVQICGEHGMYVYPRIGPWVHGEVRNGGLPDWVLKNSPVRQNDPVYLKEVQSFYSEIAKQLQGLLWKDGGPVIGIQFENEYRGGGPGKGSEHIRTLKSMAIADGLEVPLYTVTGWDGAAIPLDAVLPVFGGYPDAPWADSAKKAPPNEVYAFRFTNRAAGSMGAIGGAGQNSASSYRGTPFLTAEVGDGIEDTYFRRPVLSADDVAAIAPVMLGSGVNLLGFYMFHGGWNPDGGTETLQESQRTGYPTDVPVRSYDFQAPLGEFGQERESLRKLKLVSYFLNDFGALLAPMSPRAPVRAPANPGDTSVPRVAARTSGDQGFLFLNNHVRGLWMPARAGFQVELKLPSGGMRIPETPIDLPSGAYGIWPVNLALGGAVLRYSTAQLFKRIEAGDQTYFFFFAIAGVRPEFVLDNHSRVSGVSGAVETVQTTTGLRLRMSATVASEVRLRGVHLVLLPGSKAEEVWRVDDPSVLLMTEAAVFSDGPTWTFESDGQATINFGLFRTQDARQEARLASGDTRILREGKDGIFQMYRATLPQVTLEPRVTFIRPAAPRPPWKLGPVFHWRPEPVPLAPDDADFGGAAVWKIELPPIPATVSDAYLRIRYMGDVARLYRAGRLVDDNFWNGLPWSVGMKEIGDSWRSPKADPNAEPSAELELRILPLPKNFPMYLEKADELRFSAAGVADSPADSLTSVELIPQYRLVLKEPAGR